MVVWEGESFIAVFDYGRLNHSSHVKASLRVFITLVSELYSLSCLLQLLESREIILVLRHLVLSISR